MTKRLDVANLGQVFTPSAIVDLMLSLRQNRGRTLEPSSGDGAFSRRISRCVAIEYDARVASAGAKVMDFFAYSLEEKFACVIGNPPYVRYQDIPPATKALLDRESFDGRSNLFLFFIEKSIRHLKPGGELIFIVPREFIKLTAAQKLNSWLFAEGTITHWVETGDARLFSDAVPNCAIFRFERGNFTRKTLYRYLDDDAWQTRNFIHIEGQLAFTSAKLTVPMAALFDVKVGAVSGADDVFTHPQGNYEFVFTKTIDTGETRRMLYNQRHTALLPHKERLLGRRIRTFDESNWWTWGRAYHRAEGPRIYVNGKTRRPRPFFTHDCAAYDGSILALFPKIPGLNIRRAIELLNDAVPWEELGFVVDGRYLFSQRTLQTILLPDAFAELRRPAIITGGTCKRSQPSPEKTNGVDVVTSDQVAPPIPLFAKRRRT